MSRETLEVYDVRGNSSGLYVTLRSATKGNIGHTATITVKWSPQYEKAVCLTCISNSCYHARYVEGGINDGTIKESVAA